MTFGDDWGCGAAKDQARKVCDAFREAGGNFIDTANVYTNGSRESFLGESMQGHRQSAYRTTILASTLDNPFAPQPNAGPWSLVQIKPVHLKPLE
jgi:aryl-alcohol dehydrogenase-like predicted oxidoreductase